MIGFVILFIALISVQIHKQPVFYLENLRREYLTKKNRRHKKKRLFKRVKAIQLAIFICIMSIALVSLKIALLCIALLMIFQLFFIVCVKHQHNKKLICLKQNMPVTLERLLICITSGVDILSACQIVVNNKQNRDLFVEDLRKSLQLLDSGISFAQALRTVALDSVDYSIQHTLIYLALAYEQGGELKTSLQELSKASQLQYQEEVEEQIAKMPVQATLPLLLIFTGLLIFLITPAILEVFKLTKNASI